LKRVCLLIDAAAADQGQRSRDHAQLDKAAAFSYQVILTKADELKA